MRPPDSKSEIPIWDTCDTNRRKTVLTPRLIRNAIVVATAMAYLAFVPFSPAQDKAADAKAAKATPRSLDGHPDLTGFWAQAVAGIPGYGKEPVGEAGNLREPPMARSCSCMAEPRRRIRFRERHRVSRLRGLNPLTSRNMPPR